MPLPDHNPDNPDGKPGDVIAYSKDGKRDLVLVSQVEGTARIRNRRTNEWVSPEMSVGAFWKWGGWVEA